MPRAGLTTDAVVDVALALVDEKGPDALSLAAVADRAGVAAPSLYKHVGSLAALRDLMGVKIVHAMARAWASAAVGRSRDDAVAALMRAYRDFVLAHPGWYALVPLDPLRRGSAAMAEAGRELLQVIAAVLRGYGLENEAATHATRRATDSRPYPIVASRGPPPRAGGLRGVAGRRRLRPRRERRRLVRPAHRHGHRQPPALGADGPAAGGIASGGPRRSEAGGIPALSRNCEVPARRASQVACAPVAIQRSRGGAPRGPGSGRRCTTASAGRRTR